MFRARGSSPSSRARARSSARTMGAAGAQTRPIPRRPVAAAYLSPRIGAFLMRADFITVLLSSISPRPLSRPRLARLAYLSGSITHRGRGRVRPRRRRYPQRITEYGKEGSVRFSAAQRAPVRTLVRKPWKSARQEHADRSGVCTSRTAKRARVIKSKRLIGFNKRFDFPIRNVGTYLARVFQEAIASSQYHST